MFQNIIKDQKTLNKHNFERTLTEHSGTYAVNISAVKRLIAMNHIQNKSFCLHNICVALATLLGTLW